MLQSLGFLKAGPSEAEWGFGIPPFNGAALFLKSILHVYPSQLRFYLNHNFHTQKVEHSLKSKALKVDLQALRQTRSGSRMPFGLHPTSSFPLPTSDAPSSPEQAPDPAAAKANRPQAGRPLLAVLNLWAVA